ncbi:hypothetical protein BKA15_004719 [Microlunatus parietis]|uniref:Uncharacterized protein n=1 Tax=Microlunatus parietis TaxID=682979 RepID=A0A7Y9IB14_9ACTN|nr:hypothetical protein [Microlunatus parietis]NYE73390.1 hypothetical protein [Microlunatus parietis]
MPIGPVLETGGQQRDHGRGVERHPDPLSHPGDQQQAELGCDRRQHSAGRCHERTHDQQLRRTEPVGEPSGQQQHPRERERRGADQPLQDGWGDVEVRPDGGQHDRHRLERHHDAELSEAECRDPCCRSDTRPAGVQAAHPSSSSLPANGRLVEVPRMLPVKR